MLETLLSNRTVSVLWEALPRILSAGLTMTIPSPSSRSPWRWCWQWLWRWCSTPGCRC